MGDILDTNIGPAAVGLSISGGKLIAHESVAAIGEDGSVSIDSKLLLEMLRGYVDAKFPAVKAVVDIVMGLVESSVAAL